MYGDGLRDRYLSEGSVWSIDEIMRQAQQLDIQEQSCLELLCYLVVSAPARVRLHPRCFIGGEKTVQEFQTKAVEVGRAIGFTVSSLAWQIP